MLTSWPKMSMFTYTLMVSITLTYTVTTPVPPVLIRQGSATASDSMADLAFVHQRLIRTTGHCTLAIVASSGAATFVPIG